MKFMVFVTTPRYQGFFGPIPEKTVRSNIEASDMDAAVASVNVPLGSKGVVILDENIPEVVKIEPRLVNQRV